MDEVKSVGIYWLFCVNCLSYVKIKFKEEMYLYVLMHDLFIFEIATRD